MSTLPQTFLSPSVTNSDALPPTAIGISSTPPRIWLLPWQWRLPNYFEPFQWLTEEQSRTLTAEQSLAVREEMADVLLYLIRLADKLDVDLVAAASDKIVRNSAKYPVEKSRGSSKKYTDL